MTAMIGFNGTPAPSIRQEAVMPADELLAEAGRPSNDFEKEALRALRQSHPEIFGQKELSFRW